MFGSTLKRAAALLALLGGTAAAEGCDRAPEPVRAANGAQAPDAAITEFWRWFADNSGQFRRRFGEFKSQDEVVRVFDEIRPRLRAIDPGLTFEFGPTPAGDIEFVISADGVRRVIPSVVETVRRAPTIDGFKVTAFRQRSEASTIEMVGRKISIDDLSYRAEPDGDRLAIEVFFDPPLPHEPAQEIGFILLDQVLGEYDVMTGLSAIEFGELAPKGAKPLKNLVKEFDAFRPQSNQ